jgi:predicted kinase
MSDAGDVLREGWRRQASEDLMLERVGLAEGETSEKAGTSWNESFDEAVDVFPFPKLRIPVMEPAATTKQQARKQPTLYLMIGLPGAGKTTRAKEIEVEHAALRLTPDEWIVALYGNDLDRPRRDAVRDPVEAVQWHVAKRALSLGCNVVLDWGFWSRAERSEYQRQAEGLGARVEVVFLDAGIDELWSRILRRDESTSGTLHITRSELEYWSTLFEPPAEED